MVQLRHVAKRSQLGAGFMKKLRVKQVRSTNGKSADQRLTIKGLGLGKINREVVLADTPAIRGMVTKVQHLVSVSVEEAR